MLVNEPDRPPSGPLSAAHRSGVTALCPIAAERPTVIDENILAEPFAVQRDGEQTTETAGIYNTVGFNDDTRAFPSIPARHDLSRRVDANYLAGLVARHIVDMEDAQNMIHALAYDLAKSAYKL